MLRAPFAHLLLWALPACAFAADAATSSAPDQTAAPADIPALQLTATLVTPTDIELNWKDNAATPATLYALEWTGDLSIGYVVLAYLGPRQTSYRHVDLMSETPQNYRVRPIHGTPTPPVDVKLPAELSEKEYIDRMNGPEDYTWGEPEKKPAPAPTPLASLRDPKTASRAIPTHLKTALMPVTVSGFKVTWTDRANDEEGYLVEMKNAGETDFAVVALTEPDVTAIGYALAPPHRSAQIRVRAFYMGAPSNTVQLVTGIPATAR
jgi:hypothetical protein